MNLKKLLQEQGEIYGNLTSNKIIQKCNETIKKPPEEEKPTPLEESNGLKNAYKKRAKGLMKCSGLSFGAGGGFIGYNLLVEYLLPDSDVYGGFVFGVILMIIGFLSLYGAIRNYKIYNG